MKEEAEMLPVTQADRDAAADTCVAMRHFNSSPMGSKEECYLREGKFDMHYLVQAFARHRLATLSEAKLPVEGFAAGIEAAACEIERIALLHRDGNRRQREMCEAEKIEYSDNGFVGLLFTTAIRVRNLSSPSPLPEEDAVERTARLMCDAAEPRRIADQEEAPCFDDSGPHVQDYWRALATETHAALSVSPSRVDGMAFAIGDRVEKVSGSSWRGKVVGTYSTSLTPEGYAVESDREPGSVQIYPVKALRAHVGEGNKPDA